MKSYEIKGQERKEIGKKSSATLRTSGFIPCVVYGNDNNIHFSVEEKQVKNFIYTPEVYVAEISLESKKIKAVLKDIQCHPVSDKVMHIDFIEVGEVKPIILKLPVKVTGNSVGVIGGGKLKQGLRTMEVKGLVKDMPDQLLIDITNLNIGDQILVKDLQFKGIQLLDAANVAVVAVVQSRASIKAEQEKAAADSKKK